MIIYSKFFQSEDTNDLSVLQNRVKTRHFDTVLPQYEVTVTPCPIHEQGTS